MSFRANQFSFFDLYRKGREHSNDKIVAKTNPFLSTFWPNYYIFLDDKTLVSVIKNHHSLLCYLGTNLYFVPTLKVVVYLVPFSPFKHCRNVLCPDLHVLIFMSCTFVIQTCPCTGQNHQSLNGNFSLLTRVSAQCSCFVTSQLRSVMVNWITFTNIYTVLEWYIVSIVNL